MHSPRVWVAGEDELDTVTELLCAFRDWLGYDEPDDAGIRRVLERLLRDPQSDYLLGALRPDAPAVGVVQLRYRLCVWTGADDCWLEDMYVRDDARRGGLGRALVDAAVARARERGCRRMDLDVNEQNGAALAFYRSMGFNTEPKPPGRTFYIARRLDHAGASGSSITGRTSTEP